TTAVVRPMETTLAAQGILTPGQGASARVAPPSAGRVTSVLVREGQSVRAGQLVALLDNRVARAQTGSAAAAVAAAQADVRGADIATRAAQSEAANAIRQASLNLDAARKARDAAIRAAQNDVRQAQTELQRAQI